MEPEPKEEVKPKGKVTKLDFNDTTQKQLDSLKKLAPCIHEKTNTKNMKLGHLLFKIVFEMDLDSAMDCFPSYTTDAQKEKIRNQLNAAVLKFQEMSFEEQNMFQSDLKVERYQKEEGTNEEKGEKAKSKAQEKREKQKEREEREAELKAERDKLVIVKRPYKEELEYIEKVSSCCHKIKIGFVDGMRSEGLIFVNDKLMAQVLGELQAFSESGHGAFIPAIKQVANVGCLPGIVGSSMAMPDIHSGYGFAIGNIAAFDMDDPEAIVSPGGVGFDINCGVRLVRTNLMEEDVLACKIKLADELFKSIPVGVGSQGGVKPTEADLKEILDTGVDWSIKQGHAWPEDKNHIEEQGRMMNADSKLVSNRAISRGLSQVGSLGSGNHYCEVQVIEEIFEPEAAAKMGLRKIGQIVIFIHSGSRGLGHQVASDALKSMERLMESEGIKLNDRQLSCGKINSSEGQKYLKSMAAAANYAFVNRQTMTHLIRDAFSRVFARSAQDLDMHLVYDVSHNIAKVETHVVNGVEKSLLVHRKGSTRAFPPFHPSIPDDYKEIGQPILIGGSMGTYSYVLTGTQKGMETTFGSTCHGAGRNLSRNESRREFTQKQIEQSLDAKGITIRIASPKLIMEEAPSSYKDVCSVIETCHEVGISKKCVKLRPLIVVKG